MVVIDSSQSRSLCASHVTLVRLISRALCFLVWVMKRQYIIYKKCWCVQVATRIGCTKGRLFNDDDDMTIIAKYAYCPSLQLRVMALVLPT